MTGSIEHRYRQIGMAEARSELEAAIRFFDEAQADPDNSDQWLQLALTKLYAATQSIKQLGVQLPPLREKPTRKRYD